eukprot:7328011-Lingulodinium_polyedra.AAC.1
MPLRLVAAEDVAPTGSGVRDAIPEGGIPDFGGAAGVAKALFQGRLPRALCGRRFLGSHALTSSWPRRVQRSVAWRAPSGACQRGTVREPTV